MNRREFLQQLSCAMAVAGVASNIPEAVHAREGLRFHAANYVGDPFKDLETAYRTLILNDGWLAQA